MHCTPSGGADISFWLNNKKLDKGQNPLHQFPRSKFVTSWRGQVRRVCCVVSFPKFYHNNTTDLLPTCFDLLVTSSHGKIVCRVANKSARSWQLPRPRLPGSYGETCLMDFGRKTINWPTALVYYILKSCLCDISRQINWLINWLIDWLLQCYENTIFVFLYQSTHRCKTFYFFIIKRV